MKDKEPQTNWEQKFKDTQKELIAQIKKTYKPTHKNTTVVIRIVSNEWEGGNQALLLGSNGSWEAKILMSGYSIGKKPELNSLLMEYADIKDKDYQDIALNGTDDEIVDAQQNLYLSQNRDKLLKGLVGEMEKKVKELRENI